MKKQTMDLERSTYMEEWKTKYRNYLKILLIMNICLLILCGIHMNGVWERANPTEPTFSEYEAVPTVTKETGKEEERKKVIPSGLPVGIYIETEGSLVLGTQSVKGIDGTMYEPAKHVVKSGDYIKKVNGKAIHSKEELMEIVKKEGKKPIVLQLIRNNKTISVKINAVMSQEKEEYQLGIWVRDNSQGIGTMTYMSETAFAALGHGIHDIDTGGMMVVNGGYIFSAKILSIKKGEKGKPGEMVGTVCYDFEHPYGTIKTNTTYGIYGKVEETLQKQIKQEEVEIAKKTEVKKGKAYIRSAISGTLTDYEVNIVDVDAANRNLEKGMVIKITDKRLLSLTNGIVQGMSGTPILQNGRLVGAITHVFVQDSTQGYGTFIENMLEQSNKQEN